MSLKTPVVILNFKTYLESSGEKALDLANALESAGEESGITMVAVPQAIDIYRIKEETNKPIHMWSGYTWEELIKRDKCVDILLWVDTLVDGRFELDKRDLTLKHKGSTNQREIDVQKSLKQGKIILINP